jgi:hypothetical protein
VRRRRKEQAVEAWLTTLRCSLNPNHLLYVEEAVAGRIEPSAEEEIGCLWGDEGVMERLPGEFEVTSTGEIRGLPAPTAPTLPVV